MVNFHLTFFFFHLSLEMLNAKSVQFHLGGIYNEN